MKYKYKKEILEKIVLESISVSEVMRKLGVKLGGGNHKYLSTIIKKFNINTKHFLGKGYNKGKFGPKKSWNEILIINPSDKQRIEAFRLRKALIESGRKYKCVDCGLEEIWNNKKITLEIHHKNRNWSDNRPENLDFLCPNCHSQQEKLFNYKFNKCVDCNCKIDKKSQRCKSCAAKQQLTKIIWPTKDQLKEMLKNESYRSLGKKLGVSDNAIRKRLRNN